MGVMGGSEKTPLSAVRPCGMEVPSNEALDMSKSLHLIISYLLVRARCRNLQFQS